MKGQCCDLVNTVMESTLRAIFLRGSEVHWTGSQVGLAVGYEHQVICDDYLLFRDYPVPGTWFVRMLNS